MKLRDIIGLVGALILAVGVAFLTRIFLTKNEIPQQVTEEKAQHNKILVAGKELRQGVVIQTGDLVWQQWPEAGLNANYIKEGTIRPEELVGAIVKDPLTQGEPVTASALVKTDNKGILAALIAPGMRALSVDVTAQSASSGLIAPGDRVDVIMAKLMSSPSGGNQYAQSRLIVSNVKVLAIDVEMAGTNEKPKNAPRVATLEVSPAQAERLATAMKDGVLSLSLHSLDQSKAEAVEDEELERNESIILMRGKDKTEVQIEKQ